MRDADLRALRGKYERILRLRELHARGRDHTPFVEPDPRPAMAELARAFPGALREIDELPLDDIHARIAALDAAEDDPTRELPWMRVQVRFHQLARGALAVKRWLAGRPLTAAVGEAFIEALATMREREDAALWASDLAAIATPPDGRVMDLVYARLAGDLGVTEEEARAAVHPPRPSARRSLRRRRT